MNPENIKKAVAGAWLSGPLGFVIFGSISAYGAHADALYSFAQGIFLLGFIVAIFATVACAYTRRVNPEAIDSSWFYLGGGYVLFCGVVVGFCWAVSQMAPSH